jgi:polyhydroxybutyrate depolymerase
VGNPEQARANAASGGIGMTAASAGGGAGVSIAGSSGRVSASGAGGSRGSAGSTSTGGAGSAAMSGLGGSAGGTGAGSGATAGAGGNAGSSAACSGTSMLAPGEMTRTIQVGGMSRSYILHVPPSYKATTAAPLVIDFHALGGTGGSEKASSGYAALADQNGFVILWPDGIDNAWNIGPCCTKSRGVDDLGFAKAMVAETKAAGCIDARRVYATGFSMGGGISHFLACNAADVFAAVAPSSFDLLDESEEPCHPSRPVSVLSFRGTSDPVVPYAGGASTPPNGCCPTIHFLGATGTLMKWAQLDGCTGSAMSSGSDEMLYVQCGGGAQLGLVTIQGGSHAPGPADRGWDFLKTKSLP